MIGESRRGGPPGAAHLAAGTAREDFTDTLKRVANGGERIVPRRGRKDVAALVPLKDLRLLEQIEDRLDLDYAKEGALRVPEEGREAHPLG